MKWKRLVVLLALVPPAWAAVYFGFHETDTIWFTGTKCAQYDVPGWPDHVVPAVEQSLRELEQRYDADEPSGSVANMKVGVVHVCGGWRVHLQVREALEESGPNE